VSGLPLPLTVEALKRRVDKQLSGDDDLLAEYLAAAVEQAEAPAPLGCGRTLRPDPPLGEDEADDGEDVQRVVEFRGRAAMIPDARSITTVELDGAETVDFTPISHQGLVVRLSFHELRVRLFGLHPHHRYHERRRAHTVTVTGKFGYAAIPDALAEGIYLLAARAFAEKEAGYADQVAIGEGASAIQTYFRNMPPRTRLAFTSYTVPAAIGGLS
jgi:hypothetical protein